MDFLSIIDFTFRVTIVVLLFAAIWSIIYKIANFIGNRISLVGVFICLLKKSERTTRLNRIMVKK